MNNTFDRREFLANLGLGSAALACVSDSSSIMGEILFITLESDRHSPMELRTVAETILRRRILAVPGVAQVVPTGGDQKQYQVLVSPQLLREFEILLDDVERALRQGSQNSSAGFRVAGRST